MKRLAGWLFGIIGLTTISVCTLFSPAVEAQSYTETFYVCEGGDGTLPETATCGTAYDTADFNTAGNWDTDDSDDGKIGPNDRVILLDDGGKHRATFYAPVNGHTSNITIQGESGGTAEITGFDLITTWTEAPAAGQLTADGNTVALWEFDDDLTDESGNGRTLTDNGSIAYVSGIWDKAADFDGSTDYLTYDDAEAGDADAFDFGNNDFTVEVIIKMADDAGSSYDHIVTKHDNGAQYRITCKDSVNGIWIRVEDGASHVCTCNSQSLDTLFGGASYHNVALVVDEDGDCEFWLDGVKKCNSSMSALGAADNAEDFSIGAEPGGTGKSHNDIEQVRVSDIARTSFTAPFSGQENVWQATVSTEPKDYVLFDGTEGTEVSSCPGDVDSANEWCWDSSTLYVYSTSDPDTAFTSPGIEAAQRDYAFHTDQGYLTLENLIITGANGGYAGLKMGTWDAYTPSDIVVDDCEIKFNRNNGVWVGEYCGDQITIQDSNIHHNGGNGILVSDHIGSGSGTESYIKSSTIHDNVTYGIFLEGDYYIVEYNKVYDNGESDGVNPSIAVEVSGDGVADNDIGNNNIVRYNEISGQDSSGNDGAGVLLDKYADHNTVHNNVIFDNEGGCVGVYVAQDNVIYNNTCYANSLDPGGAEGSLHINDDGTDRTTRIVYKNNIFYGTAVAYPVVYVAAICTNDDITIDYNVYYQASGDWWQWGASTGDTLAGWQSASSEGANDQDADPKFNDASSDDFTLQAASPAINAGTDLGATYDDALDPISSWPNNVLTMDQDRFGSGWEIGAYVFTRTRQRRHRGAAIIILNNGGVPSYINDRMIPPEEIPRILEKN